MTPRVQLEHVRNVVSRTVHGTAQQLEFGLRVRGAGFGKRVTVHWSGEDGAWHTLPAKYIETLADASERWMAALSIPLSMESSIPGNIRFAACLEHGGGCHWDSRYGEDYRCDADSGLILYGDAPMAVVSPPVRLHDNAVAVPLSIAVRHNLEPESITVHWTLDAWKTTHTSPAYFRRDHWDRTAGSNARNPNRYGWEVWAANLPIRHAYRLEFAVECRTRRAGILWDNREGHNYRAARRTLNVMTLNLHTWQEDDQLAKFALIARAIQERSIDIVCLQEVGERWNGGAGDWPSNAARIINSHLPTPFHLHTDWSHLGFDRFREGVAILSRHPFLETDSGYISESADPYDINSRRVVMARVNVPCIGPLNIFSAHLSWPSGGFFPQYGKLRDWVNARASAAPAGTLICGDFNIAVESEAFRHIVHSGGLEDQFLKITNPSAFQRVFRTRTDDPTQLLRGDGRIDYIWLTTGSTLRAIAAEELFTGTPYSRVSDHTAYRIEFERR